MLVDAAIHFDHDFGFRIIEINNKTCNRVLPSEVDPAKLVAAKVLPQNVLLIGRQCPKVPSSLYVLATDAPRPKRILHGVRS